MSVHGAGIRVAALRAAEQTAPSLGEAVEAGDDPQKREPVGRHGQVEAAALAADRRQHAGAHQLVQHFPEVVLRNVGCGGEVGRLHWRGAVLPRNVNHGPQRVFSSL